MAVLEMVVCWEADKPDKSGEELTQTMRMLAANMAFLMKSIALGKETYGLPQKEKATPTHFIR